MILLFSTASYNLGKISFLTVFHNNVDFSIWLVNYPIVVTHYVGVAEFS